MPNRYLRETFKESERINAVSFAAEVVWTHLLVTVDDFGRVEANPKILRPKLFPCRLESVSERELETLLQACKDANLIEFYASNGKRYLQMMKWEKGRAKKSKCPEPPQEVLSVCYIESEDEPEQKPTRASKRTHLQTNVCKREQKPTPENISPVSDPDPDSGTDSGTDSVSVCESEGAVAPKAHTPEASPLPKRVGKSSDPKADFAIYPMLQTPEFEAAWLEWIGYKEARKEADPTESYLPNVRRANLDFLARKGSAHAVAVVRFSLAKGAKNLILDAPQEQLAAFTPKAASPVKEIANAANTEFETAVNALVCAVRENRLADASELKKRASQAIQRAAFAVLSVEHKNVFSKLGRGEA